MQEPEILIAAPVRTAIGAYGGVFRDTTAAELAVAAAGACMQRAGIEAAALDEVLIGNARQAGAGPNIARQISVAAGVPVETPAWTVNKACGSGLQTIVTAAQAIRSGDIRIALAGGTESMSGLPYLLPGARWGYRLGSSEVVDAMYRDGFHDPICGLLMGETAEVLADEYDISREEQDRFACESQRRCQAAREADRFADEIVEVEATRGRESLLVASDEHPRDDVRMESLARLPTVFSERGTVTPGNACGITDGAAACLVLTREAAEELGVEPMARLAGWASAGVDPRRMGIGPVPAVRALEESTGVRLGEVELVELNEAFAVQVLACARDLGDLDLERTNVNGGAIALGHPIGCTGTRIVVTLLHEMQRRGAHRGVATLCISGGQGMAALFERMEN